MDPLLLLPPDQAEWLLDGLAGLVAARGPGPLVSHPMVELTRQFFPERWTGTPRAVEILARRLLGYAGIQHLEAIVDTDARLDEREAGECALEQPDLPIWFAGLAEGSCLFGVREEGLADAGIAAAALAHAVAHAFRAHLGLAAGGASEGTYREGHAAARQLDELEERLADVTAVYLGFGVIMANAPERKRSERELRAPLATWQFTTMRVGARAMSYLLAAQALARGMTARERKALSRRLQPNPAAVFETACESIGAGDIDALRARLGVPAPEKWPAPPDLAALTRPDPGVSGALVAQERPSAELANRGRPVFRVVGHQGVRFTVLFVLLGMFPAGIAWSFASAMTAATITGLGVIGYLLGKTRRRDECSDGACGAPLPRGVKECPKCGGKIVGEIERPEDRLAALEKLEEDRLALAATKRELESKIKSAPRAPRAGG
jgi:hypothetical protein